MTNCEEIQLGNQTTSHTADVTPFRPTLLTGKKGDKWASLEAILQGNPVATFVIDTDHKVTHWNHACELITGIAASDMIGSCDQWKGFYTEARPVLADLIVSGELEQAMKTYVAGNCRRSQIVEGAYEAEGFFPLAGGNGRWLFFTAAPVRNASGQIISAIETLQDITERRAAEKALQDQYDKLEELVDKRTAELQVAKTALEQDIQRRQQIEKELLERNTELLELTQERSRLEERASFASTTAMTAMSSMGEMGVLLQALQHYNGCRSTVEIADAIIASLANYDLTGAVQIRTPAATLEKNTSGTVSPHDVAVISRLANMGRIVHFHSRMIINYDYVSLLIHNIPKEDAEKVGRIRDNLAILVEAADVRTAALLAEAGSVSRQSAILATVGQISAVLSAAKQEQQRSLCESSQAIEHMVHNLEKQFVHLGLTPSQEDFLMDLINASIEQITKAQSGQLNFQQELSEIICQLKTFSTQ